MRGVFKQTDRIDKRRSLLSIEERKKLRQKRDREYHQNTPFVRKQKSYLQKDKFKGWDKTLTINEFRGLINEQPYCTYCGQSDQTLLGLDRKDNNRGHDVGNVVVCCEKCNNILSDIPFEAKELLKTGLTEIHEKGLLTDWIIATKWR